MHNRTANSSDHYFNVKYIQYHREYRGALTGYRNDIALLTLTESINSRPHLRAEAISLPASARDTPSSNGLVTAIGWGVKTNTLPGPEKRQATIVLRCANFSVVDSKECGRRLGEDIYSSKICIDNSEKAVCMVIKKNFRIDNLNY